MYATTLGEFEQQRDLFMQYLQESPSLTEASRIALCAYFETQRFASQWAPAMFNWGRQYLHYGVDTTGGSGETELTWLLLVQHATMMSIMLTLLFEITLDFSDVIVLCCDSL